jgi:hypothetical protein
MPDIVPRGVQPRETMTRMKPVLTTAQKSVLLACNLVSRWKCLKILNPGRNYHAFDAPLRSFGLVLPSLWPGLLAEFTELKFSLNFTPVNASLRRKHKQC